MNRTVLLFAAAVLVAGSGHAAAAQDTGRGKLPPAGRGRAGRGLLPLRPNAAARAALPPGGRDGQPPLAPNERAQAMRQIRQRMFRKLQVDGKLSQEQVRSLQQTDVKYDRQRNQLQREENQTRRTLIAAMQDTTAERDQAKVSQYLDQLTQFPRKRAELLEGEQKELSSFLTPLQRAQYLGLKERVTKALEKANQQAAPPPAGAAAKPDTLPPER